jgi:small-conductance mechanosensitive channel
VYIVAIAWLYVVLMMALTERSLVAGVATFVFYGLAPLALFLWLVGTPQRNRYRRAAERERERERTGSADAPDE